MKSTQKNKKPFGLTLACKIAADALTQNVAPASTIVGNLFFLQTSEHFPKELDVLFFAVPKRQLTDNEKKIIVQLLPELKKPAFQIPEILENVVKDGWVKKVPLPQTPVVVKKPTFKKKTFKKPVSQETINPNIIVRKNKSI
jgi:hypothetical protein